MINTFKSKLFIVFRKYSLPRWSVLLIDMSLVYFSFLIAYMLKFNFEAYTFKTSVVINQAFFVMAVYTLFMLVFKSYAGMVRHTTLKDTYKIISANFTAVALLIILIFLNRQYEWDPLFNISLSILLIHVGALTILLFLIRISVKIFYEFATSIPRDRKNVLIYGAGEMGIIVKRLIEADNKNQYQVNGFIDDDKKIQGKKVDGYPVYSRQILTKEFFEKKSIKAFIIAINKIAPSKKKDVIESIIQLGCDILDTPTLDTWLNGNLEIKNLKKVKFEDLLGRDPITLNLEKIEKGLFGKTILVTGAAGSIGSEIARQLSRFKVKQLVLVDQAETPSFYLEEELKNKQLDCNWKVVIGDVTREDVMNNIFSIYRPEIVFHAAAYKHVPIMEAHPREAFRVNVGGTKNVADISVRCGVEKFVMISTDKAVNPTNVMGATKKICEMLVQAYSQRKDIKTQFIITRFGNVLGSNGSVIPLFSKQIHEGGPVTITHPEITRFFMTIPEACQLVLEAGFMGNGGQIFVFDMGNPVKILDAALTQIRLSGLEPHKDIKIKFTGLRPGEKLYEELFSTGEQQLPTYHPKISIAQVEDNNFDEILLKIGKILNSLYQNPETRIIEEMKEIVPGYKSKFEVVG
ncbi:MAG: polysaccharide biosynthesis protein [Bacteroidales bacterium]|jgi:FlaA1/EpsC-like NDP-sugar epimerase|nr:polysaccharide biosynthesis protein [Bacteroidales bacterium]